LGRIVSQLPTFDDPALLVGTNTADDAAVYRMSEDLALVQTVDFFTPIVDDPFDFGRIAAANSLSDIYAMGAKPLIGVNIIGFPVDILPIEYLVEILKGGAYAAQQAGMTIVGGHTIDDREPKYGLAVTGTVHPTAYVTNATARPGNVLVLTKPLGTGVVATAIKRGTADSETVAAATLSMTTLNRDGAEAALAFAADSMTDVTGFGLLGHLLEMCDGSDVGAEVWFDSLPWLPGVGELAVRGVVPGGTRRNLDYVTPYVSWDGDFEDHEKLLAADAQTSGGLLIAVAEEKVEGLLGDLRERGTLAAATVGRIMERTDPTITVRRAAGSTQ
jgi:selenide,water dikinase